MNAYEEVFYPCHAYQQTLPSHLGVIARIYGLDPAPPDRCRVLEVGCGDGGNLLPMAALHPHSEYVGIDLAPTPLIGGRALAEEAGLTNLTLEARDLRELAHEGAQFDYIIAHGFFSWVPEEARVALLDLCREVLSPHGVAFISYNAYPGAHGREMLRQIMRFHASDASTADEMIAQARSVAGLLADGIPEDSDDFATMLKSHARRVLGYVPEHLYHDDLSELSFPFHLHEMVTRARGAGLEYLGDADFRIMHELRLPDSLLAALRKIPDPILREQYFDFVRCRRFRQTLLCRGDAPVTRLADPQVMRHCWFSVARYPDNWKPDELPPGPESEQTLALRMVRFFCESWPARHSWQEVREMLDTPLTTVATGRDASLLLSEVLLEAFAHGMIHAYPEPAPCAAVAGPFPEAGRLIRVQLAHGPSVASLLHRNLMLKDPPGRHLLSLLDGTRDRAALTAEMQAWAQQEKIEGDTAQWAADQVAGGLDQLTKLGLLVK